MEAWDPIRRGHHGTWDCWMTVVFVVGLLTASDTFFLTISLYNIVIES